MKNNWFFCFMCDSPSIVCAECDELVCSGGCKHATEIYKHSPGFWKIDNYPLIDETKKKVLGIRHMTNKDARDKIEIYNRDMREHFHGGIGIADKVKVNE